MIYDYAIVGAGIFGLTLARALANGGRSVILFDQNEIGHSGASAGLLGALMPASPLVTGPLATVQLRCLSRYAAHIAKLESESDLPTGYRRPKNLITRVQPILTEQALESFTQQAEASKTRWQELNETLQIIDRAELGEQYSALATQLIDAPFSYAVDKLTAQIEPRLLLTALAQTLASKVRLQPNTRVLQIDGSNIVTAAATFQARQVIVTAGWQSGTLTNATVQGVKGQACTVAPLLNDVPLLYTRDCYVVFHSETTAIGSTTEKQWADLVPDREICEGLRDRAAQILPVLADQPLTECWAGIRTRTTGSLPLVKRISDTLLIATGGYKIGLALAFEIAEWLVAALAEDATDDFWNFVAARENLQLSTYA